MSDHQFKPGERMLLEVEIGERLPVSCDEYYYHAVAQSDMGGRRKYYIPKMASRFHPYPREGEYRLTVEELYRLASDFVHEFTDAPFFGGSPEENIEFIKQWLSKHGKEASHE